MISSRTVVNLGLGVSALLLVLVALTKHAPILKSETTGIKAETVFQLAELLKPDFGSAYPAQNITVISMAVRGDLLYFLLKPTPNTGRPTTVVRVTSDGVYAGATDLTLSRNPQTLFVDLEGIQYVENSRENSLVKIDTNGAIISSVPLEAGLRAVCEDRGNAFDLCWTNAPAIRRPLRTWRRFVFAGALDHGLAVVDGVTMEVRFLELDGSVVAKAQLSHPTLTEAQRRSDEQAARDPSSSGSAVMIADAAFRSNRIFVLAGTNTPAGKARILRFLPDGHADGLIECQLPTLAGTRRDPKCPPQPMLPVFLGVTDEFVYVGDYAGNVSKFSVRQEDW